MYSIPRFLAASLSLAVQLLFLPNMVHAVGMVPETPVVVLDEALGEASIIVRNSDNHSALLHTTIENIPEDDESLLLLTPPLARVEPGETQQVRFILQSARPLVTERLKRAVFEGIKPLDASSSARVSLSVKQNIPVILRPANLAVERMPWKHLVWSLQGDRLRVKNPSPYVVRLAQMVNVLPANEIVDLGRTYILPGEELLLELPGELRSTPTGVRLFPATTYGFAAERFDAPLVSD